MSIDSNYFVLTHYKLSRTEQEKRLAWLENTVIQLRKIKAKRARRNTIEKLIVVYESYLISKGE